MLRGSSSKGGSKIFVRIVKILRQPSSLVGMTPDGPKGPERIPKPGVIKAAQKTRGIDNSCFRNIYKKLAVY